ncbi:hypothetical protein F7P69_09545 [Cellulosimicrobium funkei]|nr:hypothetical protein [Cellulosimicrobium funkei]
MTVPISGLPVCSAVEAALDLMVGDEQLLRVLEAAVVQLHQVVEELRLVGSGTRGVAESVHSLSAMDWRSPAGEAFAERIQRLRVRAAELAEVAEESTALARVSIGELQQQIARLREALQAAKAAVATAATLGVC